MSDLSKLRQLKNLADEYGIARRTVRKAACEYNKLKTTSIDGVLFATDEDFKAWMSEPAKTGRPRQWEYKE